MKKSNIFCLQNLLVWVKQLDYIQPKKRSKLPIVCVPRRGKLTGQFTRRFEKCSFPQRFPADETHLETYIWKGNSTVIFTLVHGWETLARSRWEKLLPYFAKNRSTIVVAPCASSPVWWKLNLM
jgi:hypothetical protein